VTNLYVRLDVCMAIAPHRAAATVHLVGRALFATRPYAALPVSTALVLYLEVAIARQDGLATIAISPSVQQDARHQTATALHL
jgi:hypothetical protein